MAISSASTISNTWKERIITRASKIRVMKALVFPVTLYGCETWAVGKADSRVISAFSDVVLEKATYDITERSHYQWIH